MHTQVSRESIINRQILPTYLNVQCITHGSALYLGEITIMYSWHQDSLSWVIILFKEKLEADHYNQSYM